MIRHGFIFARGGSKGLPGKNIRTLLGKPLIAWAIEAGINTGLLDDIIVSTDSSAIAEIARNYGAVTPFMRPAELAADNSPEWLSWRHATSWVLEHIGSFDTFVSLPTTSPLREPDDVALCVHEFEKGDCDLLITCTPARRHPDFNMYKIDDKGFARKYAENSSLIIRRQEATPVFDGSAIAYVSRPDYILSASGLWDGRVHAIVFPAEKAVDIDDELDFEFAEMLMRKKGFQGQECGGGV